MGDYIKAQIQKQGFEKAYNTCKSNACTFLKNATKATAENAKEALETLMAFEALRVLEPGIQVHAGRQCKFTSHCNCHLHARLLCVQGCWHVAASWSPGRTPGTEQSQNLWWPCWCMLQQASGSGPQVRPEASAPKGQHNLPKISDRLQSSVDRQNGRTGWFSMPRRWGPGFLRGGLFAGPTTGAQPKAQSAGGFYGRELEFALESAPMPWVMYCSVALPGLHRVCLLAMLSGGRSGAPSFPGPAPGYAKKKAELSKR